MDITQYQQWVIEFYKTRKWYQYDPFIRVGFLTEEVGEVSRAVRSIEIGRDRPDEATLDQGQLKANLVEELGDVIDNILILADKYDISIEDILRLHQDKLIARFAE
ncbi:MazG nucleotide pyrophosphohydrolase domain-containing protein [Paenibacillus sanguinis]|uniref:MazG nucleotide pyrophosphohydrolase domain-containing protein n=1 Tax=Paenibacillus sanguinis TaxID=225906 RepID=UPI0003762491|nr:MazG-like family protein [Paenibacillus sanguinis]